MKSIFNSKPVKFYLWVGFAYAAIWFLHDLHSQMAILQSGLNDVWRAPYIIILNFIFFEYTYPFVFRKRAYVIYNILLGIMFLWIFMILWSYGIYGWRNLGMALHIYAPLIKLSSPGQVVESQMGYSMGSVFFFGIIRHVYIYVKLKQSAQQLQIERKQS